MNVASVRSVLSNRNYSSEYLRYKRDITDQMEHQQFRERGNDWTKFLFGEYDESRVIHRFFSRRKIKTSDIEWGGNLTKFLSTYWPIKPTCFRWICNSE